MVRYDSPYERGVQRLLQDDLPDEFDAEALADAYRVDYNRGWRAGGRGTGLEAADARGEPEAWYDGYHDRAAGRLKWAPLD